MSKAAIKTAIILSLVAILAFWSIGNYNSLVNAGNQTEQAWGSVETQYQRRLDLIDNLVEIVKGAQVQEKAVFGQLAEARSKYAGTSNDKAEAAGNIETGLARLLVITENYPELRSNQNVQALQAELAKTEDGISKARDGYNKAATNYNTNIQRFPKNLFANFFGFKGKTLFKSDAGASKAPKIKF